MKLKSLLLNLVLLSSFGLAFGQGAIENDMLHYFGTDGQRYPYNYILRDMDEDGDKDLVQFAHDYTVGKRLLSYFPFDNNKFDYNYTALTTSFTNTDAASTSKDGFITQFDADNNGEVDIVYLNKEDFHIYRVDEADGTYTATKIIDGTTHTYEYSGTTYSSIGELVPADLNKDTRTDLVLVSYKDDFCWYEQNADGTYTYHELATGDQSIKDIVVKDLNDDTNIDILALSGDKNLYLFANNGDETFTQTSLLTYTTASSYPSVANGRKSLIVEDFSGDDVDDIALAISSYETIVFIANPATSSYTETAIRATGSSSLFCADIDGDEDLDLLTAERSGYNVVAFVNNGSGTFTEATYFNSGSSGNSIIDFAMDDFDQDGQIDFVLSKNSYAYFYSSSFEAYEGTTSVYVRMAVAGTPTDVVTLTLSTEAGDEIDVNRYDQSTATINGDNTNEVTISGTLEQVQLALNNFKYTGTTRGTKEVVVEVNNGGTITSTTLTITLTSTSLPKAQASITEWPTASGITYGEDLSSSVLSGGDVSVEGTFTFSDETITPSVGSYSAEVTFTPDDVDNYESSTSNINVLVSQKELTVLYAEAINKVQDGTTIAIVRGAELSGVVEGDDVQLDTEVEGYIIGDFIQSTVGANIPVLTIMSISGADADNYTLTQPAGLTANISLIAGDADVDGTITYPEIAGDIDCDGTITYPEIAGDLNGDGEITRPLEIAGDTNGDGAITHPAEVAGDVDGDGQITFPELDGDNNGNGVIDGDEGLPTTAIDTLSESIKIYSGKGAGVLNIINLSSEESFELKVYSITGQLVYANVVSLSNGLNLIDVNKMSGSYYIISLKGKNINVNTKVLIK
ncbi:hypothetical protein E9993_13725 [Labilibacter sediminis]|nr:hypothetical protein E9993_13725 [Labilibacter sediminis]